MSAKSMAVLILLGLLSPAGRGAEPLEAPPQEPPPEAAKPASKDPGTAAALGVLGFGLGHYYAGDPGSGTTYLVADSVIWGVGIAALAAGGSSDRGRNDRQGLFDDAFGDALGSVIAGVILWSAVRVGVTTAQAVDAYGEARAYNRAHGAAFDMTPLGRSDFGFSVAFTQDSLYSRRPLGLDRANWQFYQAVQPTWELRLDPVTPGAMLGYRATF